MVRMLYQKCPATSAEAQDDYGGQLQKFPPPPPPQGAPETSWTHPAGSRTILRRDGVVRWL